MVGTEQLLGGYWFLPTLLYASIIAYLIIRYIHNRILGRILLALIFAFLLLDIKIPFFGINSKMLLGALFFYYGYVLKINHPVIAKKKYRNAIFIMALLITPTVALKLPSSMPTMEISKVITYIISAILLSTSILFCFERISDRKIGVLLNYIGQHTLEILTWHFLLFKAVSFVIVLLNDLPIEQIAYFPTIQEYSRHGWWLVYTIVGVITPITVVHLKTKIKQTN